MNTCRRQGGGNRRQTVSAPAAQSAAPSGRAAAPSSRADARPAGQEPVVHRYTHPIRTARPVRRDPAEGILVQVLEALGRQSALLEELLRRTEGNKPDTN